MTLTVHSPNTLTQQFTIKWKWTIKQNPTIRFEIVRM